jgi:hypothetical protein
MNTIHEKDGFSLRAYQGDARTLLAFNLTKAKTKNLAGFTVQVRPGTGKPYHLFNTLRFEKSDGARTGCRRTSELER